MITDIPLNNLKALAAESRTAIHAALDRVLDSGWFVLGPEVQHFERDFATYCGARFCVGVGNGSDGLVLALRAAGVCTGDAVGTVANAGFYTTAAILACGARPVFIDIDPAGFLPPGNGLGAIASQRPRAVVATHLYGRMAPVQEWQDLCRREGIRLIEDCSQAHGARMNGKPAGSFGDLAVFSFYPTKNLGAFGDGGAIVGNDLELETRLRQLRQYGWNEKYHVAFEGGRNSRLDELQAAFLSARLPLLEHLNQRRRRIAAVYTMNLRNPHIHCLPRGEQDDVAHLYVVRSRRRDELRKYLAGCGIHTDIHYPVPDHLQPIMSRIHEHCELPHTEALSREVLSLPCHPGLSDEELDHVIKACCRFRP